MGCRIIQYRKTLVRCALQIAVNKKGSYCKSPKKRFMNIHFQTPVIHKNKESAILLVETWQ